MNLIAALHYGHLRPEDIPQGVDARVPLALLTLRQLGVGPEKLSSLTRELERGSSQAALRVSSRQAEALDVLGGPEQAARLLKEAAPWLDRWEVADRQGRALARSTQYGIYHRAYAEAGAIPEDGD